MACDPDFTTPLLQHLGAQDGMLGPLDGPSMQPPAASQTPGEPVSGSGRWPEVTQLVRGRARPGCELPLAGPPWRPCTSVLLRRHSQGPECRPSLWVRLLCEPGGPQARRTLAQPPQQGPLGDPGGER